MCFLKTEEMPGRKHGDCPVEVSNAPCDITQCAVCFWKALVETLEEVKDGFFMSERPQGQSIGNFSWRQTSQGEHYFRLVQQ